jgi:hypothetical protein
MQLLSVLYSLILNLGIACAAGAPPHDLSSHGTRREAAHDHHRQASRAVNTTHHEEQASKDTRPRMLQRRFDGARFTYYDAGLGACGKTNTGADFVSQIAHLRSATKLSVLIDRRFDHPSKYGYCHQIIVMMRKFDMPDVTAMGRRQALLRICHHHRWW